MSSDGKQEFRRMRRDNGRDLKEFSRLFLQLFLDFRCLYYGFLEKAWRGWKSLCSREMEPGSESSQHQKRKTVTHGLEDQKRVSDKRWKHFLLKLLKEMQVAEELRIMLLSLALAARYAQPAVDLFSWLYVLKNVCLSFQASPNIWSKELREGEIVIWVKKREKPLEFWLFVDERDIECKWSVLTPSESGQMIDLL